MGEPRSGRAHQGRLLRLRVVLVALALGVGLSALASALGATRAALACGLGPLPTMTANGAPALIYPVPVGASPPTAGEFPLQYVAGQPVAFGEDLSKVIWPQNQPKTAADFQWQWDFGDGSPTSNAIAPTHTFAKPGTYDVVSQIEDSGGWQEFDSAQVQVTATAIPNPPVARATASISAILAGQDTVTFDATGSHAVVGTHLSYLWNFGDAETATGPHVTHQFAILGSGFVALVVTDDRGARAVATVNIGVVSTQQQIPAASLTASVTDAQVGQRVTFDASGSQPATVPANDQFVRYDWDFGDGSAADTTKQPNDSHVFAHQGNYTITVQAVDSAGTPAQATLSLAVFAASGVGGGGTPGWLLIAGIALVLALAAGGGWFAVRTQQATARAKAVERARRERQELQRARRVPAGGVRPGDPRWGDSRGGARTSGSYGGGSGGPSRPGGPGPRSGGQRPPPDRRDAQGNQPPRRQP